MKIGFLINQLDNRGTGNAVLDYAHYNETLLGNTSYILSFPDAAHDDSMVQKVTQRFRYRVAYFPDWPKLDIIYHIKSGANDGLEALMHRYADKYVVHAVFEKDIHGDAYATISKWMGNRFDIPWVPHIVQNIHPDPVDVGIFREDFPRNATIFGRLGGPDTFDISWAWEAIEEDIKRNPHHFFIFANTDSPLHTYSSKNIIFYPKLDSRYQKAVFIYACDYMLHARARGETFGLSVGEFSVAGKPVITYGLSHEKAHLEELGITAVTYIDKQSLIDKLANPPRFTYPNGYMNYTNPSLVMQKFKEVFL